MDVRIVSAGCCQNVVITGGERNLLADADFMAVDLCNGSAVDQAVNERRIRIMENLLDWSGELVGRLRPVMVFHGDYKHGFQFVSIGPGLAKCHQQGKDGKREETSYLQH